MRRIFLSVVALILLLSCTRVQYPEPVKNALKQAGKNKTEIKKTIIYFQNKGDSLQLDALYYLIENMDPHSYAEIAWYDSNDVEINLDVLAYNNYQEMISAIDSMESDKGELHWKLKEKYPDLEEISSDLLIENIELAFEAWKNKPWSRSYSYNIFKEYILPYRGSNEPLESWRPYFLERYKDLADMVDDPHDPVSVSNYINEDIKSLIGFDPRFYCHPTDQGLTEMITNGLGRCEDMTNFAIYALRANGLPITSDYTPHWADTGNNHAWNSILLPDGKAIPFMGSEANPGEYNLRHRMAKAYRKTFTLQKNNLAFLLKEKEKVPPWLSGKNYNDVTEYYTVTNDVQINLENPVPDSIRFIYLSVFNDGKWKAIHWAHIEEDQSALFTDMGVDICYLPTFYIKKDLVPAGDPFILEKNGDLYYLNGDDNRINLELISVTKKVFKQATENKEISFLETGKQYELFYWDEEWKTQGCLIADDQPLLFEDMPIGHLYWLVQKDSRKDERIFTYENGVQIWW